VSGTSPVRYPDIRSPKIMTTRAWWLVGLNILIPGSAQLLAGSRRLGRFAVSTTFVLWGLIVVAVLMLLIRRELLVTIVTNSIALTVLQVLLLAYALLWIVLTFDTLRLVKLVRVTSAAPFIAALAIVGLVVSSGVALYGSFSAGSARSALGSIFAGQELKPPADGRYNVLLLGGDAGADRTGLRPDSITVASVDAETGATTLIGIPRNLENVPFSKGSPLYGPFPHGYDCGDQCLIDYLYTYGQEHPKLYPDAEAAGSSPGIEAMRDAAEGATGLTIQYFALVDMQGFSDLIDALGGVTVTVPERLAYGPVTSTKPYGYFEAGKQKMDGASALWYARSRFQGNDFERMERQRQLQQAVLAEFTPQVVLTKFQAIADAGKQVLSTDIPAAALGHFVDLAELARTTPITTLELAPPEYSGADFDKIHAAVKAAVAPKPAK